MENCNLREELENRSRIVSLAKEIDRKNGKLWEVERKLKEKDKLLQKYICGRGEVQYLREENKKLKYELELRSMKEIDGMHKYELQLRSITEEKEKLSCELESNKKEFVRRAKLQENMFAEMEKLKYKVESDTNEFELRLKGLEEQEKVIAKEKLERMENRANNAEKESMLLKKQLEERGRGDKFLSFLKPGIHCLHQKNEVEKRLLATNILVKTLQEEHHACLSQKNDLERKLSSFRIENNILVKQLREELRDYEYKLEEARKVKSSCGENIEVLTKKLLEEKGHRARAESELQKLSEIQVWTKRLEDELSSWKMMIKEIPGVSCAADITVKFTALQKEVVESTARASEANAHLKQMEEQLEGLRILNECLHQNNNDLERKFSSFRTENNILVKQLQEELRNYDSELHEARKWKVSHENIQLLKENLFEEKAHRERAELELLKLSDIQLSANKLEDELFSWKMMIEKIFPGVSCAEDIPLKFAAHQKEVAKSMVKAGAVDAYLKQMEVIAEAAILNSIVGTELVEEPILEIKGDEFMVREEEEERECWLMKLED